MQRNNVDANEEDADIEDDEVANNAKCAGDDGGRGRVMGDMIIKRVSIVIVPHVTIIVQCPADSMVNVETKEGGGEEKVAIKHYIFQISEKNKVFHAMKIVNEMIVETECEC